MRFIRYSTSTGMVKGCFMCHTQVYFTALITVLAISDLLHTHLALAGTWFDFVYDYDLVKSQVAGVLQFSHDANICF